MMPKDENALVLYLKAIRCVSSKSVEMRTAIIIHFKLYAIGYITYTSRA